MKPLGSDWTDYHESWYLGIVQKSDEKTEVLL
jgi:hypothetical protein